MKKRSGKRNGTCRIAVLLAAAVCLLATVGAWAATYDLADGPLVIDSASGDVEITGTYEDTGVAVRVMAGYTGTISLDSVKITNTPGMTNPILLEPGASPDIVLVGENVLTGGVVEDEEGDGEAISQAALNVPSGAKVRLSGEGKLTVKGGGNETSEIGGAGIGGNAEQEAGEILIEGGSIVARGGLGGLGSSTGGGPGIGGGGTSDGARRITVTVAGGTVEAEAAAYEDESDYTDVPGIGGYGSTVVIAGGDVTAKAFGFSGAIEVGMMLYPDQDQENPAGSLRVTGGTVRAQGATGIGALGSVVEIAGGTVTATGGETLDFYYKGPGIWIGGFPAHDDGEEDPEPGIPDGIVRISGGVVTATGAGYSAGIGARTDGGDDNVVTANGGRVEITGGTVMARGSGGAQDIGRGYFTEGASFAATPGLTIITGGSVSADKVDQPVNSDPDDVTPDNLVRSDLSGTPEQTVSLLVKNSAIGEYVYAAPFHPDGKAYVWLPEATSVTPPVIEASATDDGNGSSISLSATVGGSGTYEYLWQRSAGLDEPFENIIGATTLEYTDTGLTAGTTYYYRLRVDFGSEEYLAVSETVSATVSGAGLTGLTISPGTLSPVFEVGRSAYTALVANDVANITVTPAATAGATVSMKVAGTATASLVPLKVGSNAIDISVSYGGSVYATCTVTVTRAGLTGLSLSHTQGTGPLSPAFDGTPRPYTADVADNIGSVAVVPVWSLAGTSVRVNDGTAVTVSGTASPPVALETGENEIPVVASQGSFTTTYLLTVTRRPPVDDTVTLSALLAELNLALGSGTSATTPITIPTSVGTPITNVLPSDATFEKKDAPTNALSGYTVLSPSFTSSVNLGGRTLGDTLALKYTVDIGGIYGFEAWGARSTAGRIELLDALKTVFAYEYADGTWKILIGAGGVLSWNDAVDAEIVSFAATGIELNYAVTDGPGDPSASGAVLVVPDGTEDGRIVDPMWLLYTNKVFPTGLALDPKVLPLKEGETGTVTVLYTPGDATERDIVWTVDLPRVASVAKAPGADAWMVRGLSAGTALLTATASADKTKTAQLSVTVTPKASDLIESIALVPAPPYRRGDVIEARVKLTRALASVTALVRRPDGGTDAPTVHRDGLDAWLTCRLPEPGIYTVTVTAADDTGTTVKTATLTVTEDGAILDDGGGGGCNAAGLGLTALAVLLAARRRRRG